MFPVDWNDCNDTKDDDILVWIASLENLFQTCLANLPFETHDVIIFWLWDTRLIFYQIQPLIAIHMIFKGFSAGYSVDRSLFFISGNTADLFYNLSHLTSHSLLALYIWIMNPLNLLWFSTVPILMASP